MYSENDDVLPEMNDPVLYVHQTDPNLTFEEEAAGFTSHPISSLSNENRPDNDTVLLENMGMSDPECAHING